MNYENWTTSEMLDAYISVSQEIRSMEELSKGNLDGAFLTQRVINRLSELERSLWAELNKKKEVKVLL